MVAKVHCGVRGLTTNGQETTFKSDGNVLYVDCRSGDVTRVLK